LRRGLRWLQWRRRRRRRRIRGGRLKLRLTHEQSLELLKAIVHR